MDQSLVDEAAPLTRLFMGRNAHAVTPLLFVDTTLQNSKLSQVYPITFLIRFFNLPDMKSYWIN
jgi:hypothetical protein